MSTHIPAGLLNDLSKFSGTNSGGRNAKPRKLSNRISAKFAPERLIDPSTIPRQLPEPSANPTLLPAAPVVLPIATPHSHSTRPVKTSTRHRIASPSGKNAFDHAGTRSRVAHLLQPNEGEATKDLAFLYESVDVDFASHHKQQAPEHADAPVEAEMERIEYKRKGEPEGTVNQNQEKNKNASQEGENLSLMVVKGLVGRRDTKALKAEDFNIVAPVKSDSGGRIPALIPSTRKEVIELREQMRSMLQSAGLDSDIEYPTDMHALVSVVEEEHSINDTIFQEIIRQVTVNMVERGEILAEIRKRYSNMFSRVPKHVRNLHTELVAQRKLSRRLARELVQSKDTISELVREIESIKKHDEQVSTQASDAHRKLVSVLTASDNTDDILEEYHKLYGMQRNRLEESVKQAEREKRVWIDAATSLALRIGAEHGISDLAQLQKYEQGRLRAANHVIVLIGNTNDSDLAAIERRVEEWRVKLSGISQSVVEEDQQNSDVLAKMMRDMRTILRNIASQSPKDAIESSDHPLLKVFHLYDVKSLTEHLQKWVDQITSVAVRFTSDRDLLFQEEIASVRKMGEGWLEATMRLLGRNEKTTNGKDYAAQLEVLTELHKSIERWLAKLERRVAGEEGLASSVISLQNQLEDRYTTYGARDVDKPLPASERAQLKDSLESWTELIGNVLKTLSKTTEKDQKAIPTEVENWMGRILEQMNTDTDIRTEENNKLHHSVISWMVQLLVKAGSEKPNDTWDHEFHQLNQELVASNVNLMKDSSNIDMTSEDGKDAKNDVLHHCDRWLGVARRLLENEKRRARMEFDPPINPDEKALIQNSGTETLLKELGLDQSLQIQPSSTISATPSAEGK